MTAGCAVRPPSAASRPRAADSALRKTAEKTVPGFSTECVGHGMTHRPPSTPLRFVLADNVLRLRRARGWTQQQAATAAGLTKSCISKIEQADRNASIATVQALAEGFQCWPVDLLTPVHPPAAPENARAPGGNAP
jgi:DNA-binding XRE family transcriptional regulator